MKHLVLALGMLAVPKKEKSLHTPPTPLTPYIQVVEIEIEKQKPLLTTNKKTKSLVDALILVESAGNERAFNKKENACGCLQIRPIMVREVNRILRKQKSEQRFTKEDR